MKPVISAIVPSLGRSPWQAEMLAALRRELAGQNAELVWVQQGPAPAPKLAGARELLVRLPQPVGFAVAANVGLAAADTESAFVAIVNDDLVVEPGWLAALAEELAHRPRAAAVQGVHLELARPHLLGDVVVGVEAALRADEPVADALLGRQARELLLGAEDRGGLFGGHGPVGGDAGPAGGRVRPGFSAPILRRVPWGEQPTIKENLQKKING